ncbi:MAG: NAD-dependent epimerase/dehydratase family protein, partial [Candidatus Heimdallarchaeota archaeon]|nr:NAD-dependent epimerase/dehydratase family protein [Candidatus Heimdallarchaeota archaeon]
MIFESMMITGGMGQIGSYIAEQAIEENYAKKIVIYDNLTSNKISSPPNGSILVEGDILDKDSLNKCLKDHKVEAIIHCAAQIFVTNSIKDPIHDAEINIMGTLNLLNGANQNNIQHLVTIGSAAVIGHPKLIPIPPSTQKDPLSPYGISKATAELYTIKFAKLFNKNFNVVRPFNVYSPRIK